MNSSESCLAVIIAVLATIAVSFLWAGLALWFWNIAIVSAFAAPTLGYWQMYGIYWLVRILVPGRIKVD